MPDEAFPDVHALHPVCHGVLWQLPATDVYFTALCKFHSIIYGLFKI